MFSLETYPNVKNDMDIIMKNILLASSISSLLLLSSSMSYAATDTHQTALKNNSTATDASGIPGPRTCFWSRGPHSADPYLNIAYPDANVYYWAATFTVPKGAKLELQGQFPNSRYMSLISYDNAGKPIESAADYLIKPSQGSINPFVYGNKRDGAKRDYSIEVLSQNPTSQYVVGQLGQAQSVDKLHVPQYGTGQQTILYRIYLPDNNKGVTAGVPLPSPKLTLADGTVINGDSACEKLNTKQRLQLSAAAVSIPPNQYRQLAQQADKPDTWPAKNPADWFIQLDRESLIGMYTGKINDNARRSEGGFYPNLDNQYIRTIVNRKYGKLFVIRGKAPTVSKTFNNDTVMSQGQLRYWSICSNQSFANTRVNDCLFDEEIPLDEQGYYTVVVSRAEDRPRNAKPECGIGWLPMAEDGDGVFDKDVSIVQIRHMLASPNFKTTIANVEMQKDLVGVMGDYMPKTNYLMPNQLETFLPCNNFK